MPNSTIPTNYNDNNKNNKIKSNSYIYWGVAAKENRKKKKINKTPKTTMRM